MANTHRKYVIYFICIKQLSDQNHLEGYYQLYNPIAMYKGLLPDGILQPTGWN